MDSPSLELIHDCHLYISGEVVVHSSAAIAPGVLLQADPGCRLIISEGVCIGRGSIIHASGGTLELQIGATLGTGVLIVGRGTIGQEACIGSMTTILDSSVLPQQSIAPGSLIGDLSRSVSLEAVSPPSGSPAAPPLDQQSTQPASSQPAPSPPVKPPPESSTEPPVSENNGRVAAGASPQSTAIKKTMTQVYGQAYVERIMITMFPHRQALEATESAPSDPPEPPS
jgi:carbon dioxide concentrating mechanism protein CcmN